MKATTAVVREKTMEFEQLLTNLPRTTRRGKFSREGISTISSDANVGKSSLLNNLLRENGPLSLILPEQLVMSSKIR